jgi:hypothetical protein
MTEPPNASSAAVAEELELPAFDSRAARRAIWRGVVRTALTALFVLLVAYVILTVVSGLWQRSGDREERFQTVAGLGFLVAHPDWRGEFSGCCNVDLTSLELSLDVQPQTANTLSPSTRAWLRLNILGRIVIDSIPVLPQTPIEQALSTSRPSKAQTRMLLQELPEPMRASAVVELATPLMAAEFAELLARAGVPVGTPGLHNSPPVFLESPYAPFHIEGRNPEIGFARKLAWPNPTIASHTAAEGDLAAADPLTQFKAWAAKLEGGDDRNLGRLGLPPASEIKKLAANPRIHGFILAKASTETLLALLDDQGTRSVKIADVAFDLGTIPDIPGP